MFSGIIFQPMKTTLYCVHCLIVKVTWRLRNIMEILPSSVKIHLNCMLWNKAVFWTSCYYMRAWKTRRKYHRSNFSCFSLMRQTQKNSLNLDISKGLVLGDKFFKKYFSKNNLRTFCIFGCKALLYDHYKWSHFIILDWLSVIRRTCRVPGLLKWLSMWLSISRYELEPHVGWRDYPPSKKSF